MESLCLMGVLSIEACCCIKIGTRRLPLSHRLNLDFSTHNHQTLKLSLHSFGCLGVMTTFTTPCAVLMSVVDFAASCPNLDTIRHSLHH